MTAEILKCYHDTHKSFYGKAKVSIECGILFLHSYGITVGYIQNNIFYRTWSRYSMTTMRHVNEFILQFRPQNCGGGKAWWYSLPISGLPQISQPQIKKFSSLIGRFNY